MIFIKISNFLFLLQYSELKRIKKILSKTMFQWFAICGYLNNVIYFSNIIKCQPNRMSVSESLFNNYKNRRNNTLDVNSKKKTKIRHKYILETRTNHVSNRFQLRSNVISQNVINSAWVTWIYCLLRIN